MSRDLTLVLAWLSGDKEAGKKLIAENYEKVLRLVTSRLSLYSPGLSSDAEDITQEAFSRALEKIEDYNGTTLFCTWVFGFAVNCIRENIREKSKINKLEEKILTLPSTIDSELLNPETIFIKKVEVESVRYSFLSLKLEYQEIIYLRLYLGLSYKEIALEKRKSISSLESLFRRAMTAFEREYKKNN